MSHYAQETWVERPDSKYPMVCVSSFKLMNNSEEYYCRAYAYLWQGDWPARTFPNQAYPVSIEDRYRLSEDACREEHARVAALARMSLLPGVDV